MLSVSSLIECPAKHKTHINRMCLSLFLQSTVKPVLSGHSNTDETKILMTDASLMKVESIAEYSPWSILQYF